MSLKEAYETLYGSVGQDITKEFILANINESAAFSKYRKLMSIYHPDLPTGDEKKAKKINQAWDVFTKIYKDAKNSQKAQNNGNPKKAEHQTDSKKTQHNKHQNYNRATITTNIEKAYLLKTYQLDMDRINAAKFIYNEIKKATSITNIFKLQQKYSQFLKMNEQMQNETYKKYDKLRKSYSYFSTEELYEKLIEFAGKDYQTVISPQIYKIIKKLETESVISKTKFDNYTSYIFNIKNILLEVVSNSSKLNELLTYQTLGIKANETLAFLSSKAKNEDKIQNYTNYKNLKISKLINKKYWKNYAKQLKEQINSKDKSELTFDYIKKVEEQISKNIPLTKLYLLLDRDKLNEEMKNHYQTYQNNFTRQDNKIAKEWSSFFANIKKEIPIFKQNIQEIRKFLVASGIPVSKERESSSLKENQNKQEKVITKYYYYRNLSTLYERKYIITAQEHLINYYYGDLEKELPPKVKKLFAEIKNYNNSDQIDDNELDKIYYFIKEEETEVPSIAKTSTEIAKHAKKQLIKRITQELKKCQSKNIILPEKVYHQVEKASDEMSAIQIYNLLTAIQKRIMREEESEKLPVR